MKKYTEPEVNGLIYDSGLNEILFTNDENIFSGEGPVVFIETAKIDLPEGKSVTIDGNGEIIERENT